MNDSENLAKHNFPYNLLSDISQYINDVDHFPSDSITDDQLKGLEYAISTLNSNYRKVIELLYIHGWDYGLVSNTLGISIGSVSYTRIQALKAFRYNSRLNYIQYGYEGALSLPDSMRIDTVDTSPLPAAVIQLLIRNGIRTADQLCSLSEEDLAKLEDMGPAAIAGIRHALALSNRSLADGFSPSDLRKIPPQTPTENTCSACLYFPMCKNIEQGLYHPDSDPCSVFEDRSDYEKISEIHRLRLVYHKAESHGGIEHLVALDEAALAGDLRILPCKLNDTVFTAERHRKKSLSSFICSSIVYTHEGNTILVDQNGNEYAEEDCYFTRTAALLSLGLVDSDHQS